MKNKRFTLVELLIVLSIILTIFSIGYGALGGRIFNRQRETFTAKVVRKYEYNRGERGSVYRIDLQRPGSKFVETVENHDERLQGKWNSATVQANLTEGQWYQLDTVGVRNEYFSMFPNLVNAHATDPPQ